ncbi:hypothetical protein HA402_008384 [Bradysia odoriphaga]|nr:hypothetical protein HA402_008384 [Bradysia odoriphaga]
MSAGLMSCVRENSPPLEMGEPVAIASPPPDTPETQKRRRFHPLRNLRKIFRRRSVAQADTISPTSSLDDSTVGRASETSPDGKPKSQHHHHHSNQITSSVSVGGGFYAKKEKRERSADSARSKEVADELDKDMTDYQRSLSEGRLLDSEFTRDGLSQSHDSVFSESATASSLSIVLKAELVDALRKRRPRPDTSDEDLGLPRSPITPQRKENAINQSEGSLSLLSMVSSDMDDESSVGFGNSGAGDTSAHQISFTSSRFSSQNTSRSSDEVDLDMSITSNGSRLSHSAARHKMAVRPNKKKGPTRHRKPNESNVTTILPSTPEVNEDTLRSSLLEVSDIPAKLKSQSLPPGMNAKMIEKHSTTSTSTTKTVTTKTSQTSSSTTVYVNKHLSKSHDFEAHESSSESSTLERKDEDSFFKRLLNRSTKKKKNVDEIDDSAAFIDTEIKRIDSRGGYTQKGPEVHVIDLTATNKTSFKADIKENLTKREETISQTKLLVETKPFEGTSTATGSVLNTYLSNEPPEKPIKPIVKSDKPRSGPAARQRVLPQEISVSPTPEATLPSIKVEAQTEEPASEKLPPKSPKKSPSIDDPKSFRYSPKSAHKFVSSGSTSETKVDEEPTVIVRESKFIKLSQQRSEESSMQTAIRFKKFSSEDVSTSPPKSVWPEELKVRSSRVSGILSKIDAKCDPQSPKRKAVEKSKSFRIYKEDSVDNLQNSMPSLPDLTLARQFEKPKFLGVKPTFISTSREFVKSSQEFSSNSSLKFEINDNNLIRPKDEVNPGMFKKNIILTTKSPTTIPTVGNQNITQIEDNIDKIMKSSFVTVLKKSSTNDLFEIKNKNNVSVTAITTSPTHDVIRNSIAESWTDRDTSSSTSSPSTPSSPSSKTKLSPDTSDEGKVPEFMKIQLNRIDAARPKSSHVVLSKNAKEADAVEAKERRFSNESVEIAETKPATSPTTVAPQHPQFKKQSSLTKSTESVSNFAPLSPIKRTFERTTSSSSMTDAMKNAKSAVNENVVIERRKSVSDEKLKFEKKIEELKAERKRSISDEGKFEGKSEQQQKSVDDENVVVLRKKSLSQSNNNKEDTPELMKVFARRSLKVKDEDFQVHDELEKMSTKPIADKVGSNLDSDKENQSSSEEKLDKLPKAEVQSKPEEKSKKETGISGTDAFRKSNIITPKPFMMPSRFGNVNNYRNTSTFSEIRKTAVPSTPSPATANTTSEQNNNENGGNVNNNRHTISVVAEKLSAENSEKGEFKGILQRRAEWEKRAQAFK